MTHHVTDCNYYILDITESPVTVKMRIRHYFGNNNHNPIPDYVRQDGELSIDKIDGPDKEKSEMVITV